jgi:hypothetical protein
MERDNMTKSKTLKPNPALKPLEILAGNWDVEMSNASFLPDPSASVHGKISFEWVEDGAYLVMRQGNRDIDSAFATWTISRDESAKEYVMLYYDDRNVSRMYRMSFDEDVWKIWRESPGFSQRFQGIISKDGKTIRASWEKSSDGKNWEHDFDMTYTR